MNNKNVETIDKIIEKLITKIKSLEDSTKVSIYCDDPNGKYDYNLPGKNKNKKASSLDTLHSDGVVELSTKNNAPILEVSGANYVDISTVKNDEEIKGPKLEEYALILSPTYFGYFQSLLLRKNENDLFTELLKKDGLFKGDLSNYTVNKENNTVSINPILDDTKKKTR